MDKEEIDYVIELSNQCSKTILSAITKSFE